MGTWQKELLASILMLWDEVHPWEQQDQPRGVCGFFSLIPEGADGAGQRAGWGAGMLSQGIPQEHLASSLLQVNPLLPFPSELQTSPARAGLALKLILNLILKLILKLIPFPNKLLGSVPPGCVSAPIIS